MSECPSIQMPYANMKEHCFPCGHEWGGFMACDSQHTLSSAIMRLFTTHKHAMLPSADTQVFS